MYLQGMIILHLVFIAILNLLNHWQLEDEPPMQFSHMWAHDGNNSLKRMLLFGDRTAADTRVFEDDDYYLPQSYVDHFANEVQSRHSSRKSKHDNVHRSDSQDEAEDDDVSDLDGDGDPTDGVPPEQQDGIDQCVKNWKAAASDDKKKSWAIFNETGIFASACCHGLILWIADIRCSGKL